MFPPVNEIATVVTAMLAMAVGSIWYSPLLFGMQWMKSAGISEVNVSQERKKVPLLILTGVVVHAIFFYILSGIIGIGLNQGYAFFPLILLLIALCATLMVSMTVWENRPFMYFCVHVGYMAVIIFGGSAVIHYWPW